jgi:hypothetical protein
MAEQARAWLAVCRALDEHSPGWMDGDDRSTEESAVAAIAALRQPGALPDDAEDAARLDFMAGENFVSLHQYLVEDEQRLVFEVESENPEGYHRAETLREAIDAARVAHAAKGGA